LKILAKIGFCRQKPIFAGKNYFCWQKLFLPVRFLPLKKPVFSTFRQNPVHGFE